MARGTRRPRGSHAIEAGKRARYDVTLRTLLPLRMLRRNFVMWHTFALLALFASVQGRAVNISNTWVLPEEGFPVFYRYFRDRISWYEADAVCQFHHANLVTVDTTAQYDAVRAYLKELDISSAVWVGLIRSNPDGDFTWTDYRGLSGDGYWSSAPDARAAPLCAAADPAADYRWEARACGGPTVASFICELPVPQWALGNEGCMVRALPALTILYLPESAAVQLTADCGLAGVKRVQCTGNVKREDLLRDLSCAEEEDPSSTFNSLSTSVIYSVTTDAAFTDQDTTNEVTTEENLTTEHEDGIHQSTFIKSTPLPYIIKSLTPNKMPQKSNTNKDFSNYNINSPIDIIHDNNLHSNEIPKIANDNSFLTNEHIEKLEDEKNMQHKMLHDEIARLGNLETIFTQPTDHFVPPLVMARSKISDDMTVLSLEEKHAQQLAEQGKHKILHDKDTHEHTEYNNGHTRSTTEDTSTSIITERPIIITVNPIKLKDSPKKDKVKSIVPKKYNDKQFDPKGKVMKTDIKSTKVEKTTELPAYSPTENTVVVENISSTKVTLYDVNKSKSDEDPTIDLTVIIKDPPRKNEKTFTGDVPKIEVIENDTTITDPEIKLINTDNTTGDAKQEISVKIPAQLQNMTLTHEIIKITIINEENSSIPPTVFEVTTRMPVFDDLENISSTTVHDFADKTTTIHNETNKPVEHLNVSTETTRDDKITNTTFSEFTTLSTPVNLKTEPVTEADVSTTVHLTTTTETHTFSTTPTNITDKVIGTTESIITTVVPITTKESSIMTTDFEDLEKNTTVLETIDDFQSPLLSAANEPVHRPNRSRRPQQPSRLNKFNPFRILG